VTAINLIEQNVKEFSSRVKLFIRCCI